MAVISRAKVIRMQIPDHTYCWFELASACNGNTYQVLGINSILTKCKRSTTGNLTWEIFQPSKYQFTLCIALPIELCHFKAYTYLRTYALILLLFNILGTFHMYIVHVHRNFYTYYIRIMVDNTSQMKKNSSLPSLVYQTSKTKRRPKTMRITLFRVSSVQQYILCLCRYLC